jgi:hypothetical protein
MCLNETYSKVHMGKNLSDVGLKLNGTHQMLVHANDVNLLGDNIDTIQNTESLIYTSKEVGLEQVMNLRVP